MRTTEAVRVLALVLGVAACAAEKPGRENRDTISVGMTVQSPDGAMSAELLAAEPLPPLQGPNLWTVGVRTREGDPVVDLTDADVEVIANIYMAEHDHNLRKSASMTEPGVFEIPEFLITMNGYWEVTVVVHQDGDMTDDADVPMTFGFLIEN
jgi:hypothetical protein